MITFLIILCAIVAYFISFGLNVAFANTYSDEYEFCESFKTVMSILGIIPVINTLTAAILLFIGICKILIYLIKELFETIYDSW